MFEKGVKFYVVCGIILLICVLVLIWVWPKAYNELKAKVAKEEIEARIRLEQRLKAVEEKDRILMENIVKRDREINRLRTIIQQREGRIKEYEKKLTEISIPSTVPDLVREFREAGFSSATSRRR